ncbi:TonB-dependent receptor [Arcticibacter tournemirensis]|uniref:SusC/RagA family TonB-linked outer membrane protein n=1 Tax=Arcticibacter tournemirensis TaxID=699437 RepID=A0A4Q0M3F3_9SPHI|nr:TonB-dependent receptor [Arcticibacter tournemirensis]RXF67394.1 SusC/RagA family TonB-linked outer membrane protein [Arcticibacter tournemirensis]
MKLTVFLMMAAFLQVSATGYAQKISLTERNVTIEQVFKEIKKQSQYDFFYDLEMLQETKPVNISVKNASIENVLEKCFEGQPITYVIEQNTIVVKRKPKNAQSLTSAALIPVNVSGRVVDEKGVGLPGVSVRVKGTSAATSTDIEGRFRINVQDANASLVFTFIGYGTKEIPLRGQSSLSVQMQPEQKALEEVVVVGYGTQRRSSVVGAVDQVTSAAIEGRPSVNTTQALQGVSPNLVVQQRNSEPGAGMNLNVRGISTMGNNSPLVVIDGIVGGDINLLNPQDIETVSVLKDAGSAAIYGSRASNGVVLVTTKKGKKNMKPTVTYNGLAGVNDPKMFFKPVSAYENAILRNESRANSGLGSVVYTPEQIRSFKEQGDNEWFVDAITQSAWQQNHNLSVTGGSETSTYMVSVGYTDQASNFVGPSKGLRRYNYRMNLTHEYGRFKFTSVLAYTKSDIRDHASSTGTLMVDAARVPLNYRLKDDEGRYLTNDVLQEFNPLGVLEKGGFRKYDNDNIFGSLTAELKLTSFLKLKGVFGGSQYSNSQFERVMKVNYFPAGVSGADYNVNDESRKLRDLNTQFLAQFTKTFNKSHDVDVLVGVSNENHEERGIKLQRRNTDPELGTPVTETIINEAETKNSNQGSGQNSLNSLFGRASYSFDNKYYAEFNFRYDGSSKFRKGYRWGFFPAGSVGYRLTEENFMQNYRDKVGDLKLRASYGIVGNQNVGNFQYQTTFFTFGPAYGFNNEEVSATGFNFANPDLRWERAATFNIGADFSFFKNALTYSFDYFNKITKDILVKPQVPGVFGTTLPDFNAGKVRNQGWEMALSYRHAGRVLRHTVSLNVGDTKNKVLYFEGTENLPRVDELRYLQMTGFPYRSYVGYKRDGYFQNIDEVSAGAKPSGLLVQPGDNRYVDANGDGVIDDDDLFVFGNPFPRLTFGTSYNVGFKGFDLNVFFQGVGKRTMMLRGELVEPFHVNYGRTMYEHQLDYWTPQNPDARYPRLADDGSASNTNNFKRGSDLYLYSGAYLRLKNVQVGYTLPQAVSKKLGMQKLRAYLSGQNLFTWSAVKFVDPELTEFDSSLKNSGGNSGRAYPTLVYYGFGLDVTF